MIRAAAILLALVIAVPAAARCVPAAEAPALLQERLPPQFRVQTPDPIDIPALKAWLEAEGLPGHDADGFVAAYRPGTAILFPLRAGELCDGHAAVVEGDRLDELRSLVEGWRLRHGILPTRPTRDA